MTALPTVVEPNETQRYTTDSNPIPAHSPKPKSRLIRLAPARSIAKPHPRHIRPDKTHHPP